MDVRVVDNPAELRYEAWLGDELAGVIRYTRDSNVVTLVHTDIAPPHEGAGVGSELVRRALDDIRARGRSYVPLCPFVAAFIARHPEYG